MCIVDLEIYLLVSSPLKLTKYYFQIKETEYFVRNPLSNENDQLTMKQNYSNRKK